MGFINYSLNDRTGEFEHDGCFYELEIVLYPHEHVVTHMYSKSGQVGSTGRTNNFHDFEKFKSVGWSFSEINQGFKDEWKDKVVGIFESYNEEFRLHTMIVSYLKSLDNITVRQQTRLNVEEAILRRLASGD